MWPATFLLKTMTLALPIPMSKIWNNQKIFFFQKTEKRLKKKKKKVETSIEPNIWHDTLGNYLNIF